MHTISSSQCYFPGFNKHSIKQICKVYTQKGKSLVPKNISMDKEFLYEQLMNEKVRNQQLQQEMGFLNAKQHIFEKDLVNQDVHDYKRELKLAQIKLRQKDEELTKLRESIQYKMNHDLRRKIKETQDELGKYQVYSRFNSEVDQIIVDNMKLVLKLDELNLQISEMEKIRSECIMLRSKYNHISSVVKLKDQQLERYRDRDPLSEMNQRHHNKNEHQLGEELQIKNEEVENLRMQLSMARKQSVEDANKIEQMQRDFNQKLNNCDYDKQLLKERIDILNADVIQLNDRLKQIDRYMSSNNTKRKTMMLSEDMTSSIHMTQHQIELEVKNVQKQQIEDALLEFKLSLRHRKISLQDVEQIIFKSDQLSITQLEQVLQKDPLRLHKSNLVARYMIEDNHDKDFEFDPDLQSTTPQLRSILRTLMNNYTLEFDTTIVEHVKKTLTVVIDYFTRRQILKFEYAQLLDCVADLSWNSKHLDYFQQLQYNKFKAIKQFETAKLQQLFEE